LKSPIGFGFEYCDYEQNDLAVKDYRKGQKLQGVCRFAETLSDSFY